ncbi:MAG: DUF1576 domain-containing protein [Fusobacteriaceae bacterium]
MAKVNNEIKLSDTKKVLILGIVPTIFLLVSVIFGRNEIFDGYIKILKHPGVLISDYIVVGGFYANLFNVAILSFFNLGIIYFLKIPVNGFIFASYFTALGFACFGKTLLNSLPIYFGGYLYAKHQKIKFKSIFGVMMFALTLAPLVSFFMFNADLNIYSRVGGALCGGIFIGFIMTPLSSGMLKFHEGFNLYNIGFTGGIVGTILASIVKGRGIEIMTMKELSTEYDLPIKIILAGIFCIFIMVGYHINDDSINGYDTLMFNSGRLLSDFTLTEGFGISIINAGIMGLLALSFVSMLAVPLNGALIAGIFTVFGFGTFGKHPLNTIPIVLGVLLASVVGIWEFNSFNVALAGLFATTLAPISGVFGPFMGILAGFLHLFVVNNAAVIHGGFNLYNNGFAGGIVAGFLIPLIQKFRREK